MTLQPKLVLVDVDGVVADLHTEWLARYNRDFGDCLTTGDITSWDIQNYVKPECGTAIFEYLHQADLYQHVPMVPGARDGVEELRAMGYRVVFVTASNEVSAGLKMQWLAEHGFIPSIGRLNDVVIAYDKSLIPAYALVDDGLHNLETARVHRKLLFDAAHNRGDARFTRVHSWADVVAQLDPKPYVGLLEPTDELYLRRVLNQEITRLSRPTFGEDLSD